MNIRRKWRFNPIGQKFGKLTVISEAEKIVLPSGQKPRRFICKCDCGKDVNVLGLHLVRNRISSCGCIVKVLNGETLTPVCRCYKSMKKRCQENHIDKHRYFDRGITVCEEWANSYFVFKEWALKNGFKKGLQIDRIDNNKGYYPENCRFITNMENVNNREVTFKIIYNGKEEALMPLFRKLNIAEINHAAIRGRISRGWEAQKAIDTPIKKGNYRNRFNYKSLLT
jgi:hypothetical protein